MAEQIELTCDALITRLEAGLPEKIAAMNAEIEDEYLLDVPEGVSFGGRHDRTYPWIAILPRETETTMDNGMRVLFNSDVSASIWVAHWQEEGLARLLVRYQRAVREVVLSERELPNHAGYGLQHRRDQYGPVFGPGDEGLFISWVRSTYMVQLQQDF